VLARRSGEDVARDVEPESDQCADTPLAPRLAMLGSHRLFEVRSVIGPEIEWEQAHDAAENPIGPGR